ncbi:MAG TPA: branched-chain amino acid ABC transporter permease [Acetobacteraceae bacterium]|nr:branched-chain amino acid ABC transporter permease [Acetobacteraceae bacterium]
MQASLLLEQLLNGFQFGMTLFLMAAGLTLIFGIMNLINLAHGSIYMVGAYAAAWSFNAWHSVLAALAFALAASVALGIALELAVFRALYDRDHLDQVLATYGLILFFNEMVRMIWGATALYAKVPNFVAGQVELLPGVPYPVYRLVVIGVGLAVALGLYLLIGATRIGALIRAGASNRTMVGALGVNISLLYTLIFGLGAGLAALSGAMAGPIFTVESGMGDDFLILSFVVIVIGGIGSIRGSFVAAMLVGIADAIGRAFLRPALALAFSKSAADSAGPALASMLIYALMVGVLFFRPRGLFPPRTR